MAAGVERALDGLRFLHTQTPTTLPALAASRGVSPDPSWNTYELARALFSPDAVWRGLCTLSRDVLLQLNRALDGHEIQALSLPDDSGLFTRTAGGGAVLSPAVRDAVENNVDTWTQAIEAILSHPEPPEQTAIDGSPEEGFEKAVPGIVDTLGQMQWILETVGGREVSTRQASHDALAKTLHSHTPSGTEDLSRAARWAVAGGLCHQIEGTWWLTSVGEGLLGVNDSTKLATLITTWWSHAPHSVVESLPGAGSLSREDLARRGAWLFPLADVERVTSWLDLGEQWGVFLGGRPTELLRSLTAGTFSPETLLPFFPRYSDTVYPDGVDGLVAPGPLSHHTRQKLLRVAIEQRRGMTPRFVTDRDTILTHLHRDGSDHLLASLEPLIVGGVPSELRRLVVELEERARSLQLESHGRITRITCSDDYLADLLAVDHKLSRLELVRESGTSLQSPWPLESVRQVLAEAHYPTLIDHQPPLLRVRNRPDSPSVDELWWTARINDAASDQGFQPWWEALIRDAISSKTALSIRVDTGSGHQWKVVHPLSLAGGRLRVIDEASEVERTLPVRLIVAVDSAGRDEAPTA